MDLTRGQRILVLVGLAAVFIGIVILTVSRFDRAPASPVYPVAQSVPASSGEVIVHVVGAVKAPGVYRLAEGARVSEAIALAGGLRGDADQSSVNMAAVADDGAQIMVKATVPVAAPETAPVAPLPPTAQPTSTPPAPATSQAASQTRPAPVPAQPAVPAVVSLNRATKAQLEALPSIGPGLAQRILYYRYEHGPFRSVDDLLQVEGIGRDRL
ncbi:MAG: helix-hairpin-helix domain-containing protein, partial [Armatimonadia bacterium]